MKHIQTVVTLIAVGAALAVGIHGEMTGRGPVGWLDHAQQALFGAYSHKVTFLVLLVTAAVLASVVMAVLARLFPRSVPGVATSGQRRREPPPGSAR